jgi:hypothetical protein
LSRLFRPLWSGETRSAGHVAHRPAGRYPAGAGARDRAGTGDRGLEIQALNGLGETLLESRA